MRIIYFDTETTGLNVSLTQGQICQLAYTICENGSVTAKNFFFAVDYIDPAASQVTGLTVPILYRLSGGQKFADKIEEIEEDFVSADHIVAHNFSFDKKFMEMEFMRLNRVFAYKNGVCSMRSTADFLQISTPYCKTRFKNPNLKELGDAFGVSDEEVIQTAIELYNSSSVAHDARFDTVKLMLAVEKAKLVCPKLSMLN